MYEEFTPVSPFVVRMLGDVGFIGMQSGDGANGMGSKADAN